MMSDKAARVANGLVGFGENPTASWNLRGGRAYVRSVKWKCLHLSGHGFGEGI